MANHPKALHHHGKAGKALKAGDSKLAAHHLGHAMSALRSNATADEATKEFAPTPDPVAAPPQPSKLRGMLSRFRAGGVL